jgi:hypothetical protein
VNLTNISRRYLRINKMKIDLTTGTWQDNPGCPINITSVSTLRSIIILIFSGTTVIKAFIANDFIFYDDRKHIIKELKKDSLQQACLSRLPGRYKRTARTANRLPSWQAVTNLKYAPCSVQCKWYYVPGS